MFEKWEGNNRQRFFDKNEVKSLDFSGLLPALLSISCLFLLDGFVLKYSLLIFAGIEIGVIWHFFILVLKRTQ